MLAPLDWIVVAVYLVVALAVGLAVREGSSSGRLSYFLADRSLPWWWAGVSIAATTFAADTPLAVSGIIAARGISGNWLWLSWLLVHAAVVVIFAKRWWRSGVVTDAEFVTLRYTGEAAEALRLARAGLYGLVYNVIILGWVLRAMGK
ncbi:MAG: sodium transporter, partial [Gemmatimonadetes bacterium]|nr:sodium transporter [Gemmatimonadota bacterium]